MKGTNTLENTLTLSGIKQTITPPKISPSKISLSSKNHSSLQRLGFEIIEISNSTLLTEFISIWDKKSSFAFTIHWLNSIYSNSSKPIYGNNIKHQLPLWPSFILEGISVCWGETVYYIPLMLSNLSAKASKTWNILSNIFTRDWNIKMGFDMKQTLSILLNFSTKLNGPIYDPKIAAWLLDPKDNSNECYNLEKLFSQYLPSSNISGFPENNIEMICKQVIEIKS